MSTMLCANYGRFSVFPCEDGWILQDTQPDDPAYIFEYKGKRMYAAKIIGEAYNRKDAKELIAEAKRLSELYKKKPRSSYGRKPPKRSKLDGMERGK